MHNCAPFQSDLLSCHWAARAKTYRCLGSRDAIPVARADNKINDSSSMNDLILSS